eukprot:3550057-Rhodomonas_salina.2
MNGDVSKATSASHDIIVVGEGVLAIIGGGSIQQVSEQSTLRLSAAGSRDRDLSPSESAAAVSYTHLTLPTICSV